ncbi:transforming growth factor-beta-induced protein ig-h3 [Rhipicephalus sanguineus]|uniref:transforming growth factor-beta-induced protein ig-h3 n=1 Tax=Rhipicephalus sanguineus TaxID=34632 RepID=UPI001895FFC7|nr:transforming growth factor-beta-induced protein ig-h3 [Rhipicephalus sanguineus]
MGVGAYRKVLTAKSGFRRVIQQVGRGSSRLVVTANGQRVVVADASGPRGGVVHVLSGPLAPAADRDVLTTLSDCAKYDGFLTLVTGTGVSELLRRGQRTLFLPSNDALSKVPPEELKLYQKNITALKEFLAYHIVDGVYYSHDLRDGQYLKSLHNDLPIRVGVSVDGCRNLLFYFEL